mgnify:CR=1 FL=1
MEQVSKGILDDVKAGDLLLIKRGFDLARKVTVTRVTPTMVIAGEYRFRKNGAQIGELKSWNFRAMPFASDRAQALWETERSKRLRYAASMLSEQDLQTALTLAADAGVNVGDVL